MSHPNPIIDGFQSLTDFRGRTSRKRYWPYAGVVIGGYWAIGTVVGMAVAVPMMTRILATVRTTQPGTIVDPATLMPDMRPTMWVSWALQITAAILLAAATTRRLHDRGLSGFLALLPLPGTILSIALSWNLTTAQLLARANDPNQMMLSLLGSAAFWIGLILLIILLVLAGQAGENRFGLPPFDADR